MRHKWKTRRGFLKIHVVADIKSKKIVSYKITNEHSHDAQHHDKGTGTEDIAV